MNTNEQITNNEQLLFNAKWSIFQLLFGKNKFYFVEMMMIDICSVLAIYRPTWFVGSLIVLTHWKTSQRVDI